MKCIDLIAAFELEINKLDNALQKPVTDDSIYWLNQAMLKFVKERFNGNLPHRTSYEQNEKRTRDLINLLREKIYNFSDDNVWTLGTELPTYLAEQGSQLIVRAVHKSYDEYALNYPEDMMFVLNEDVVISDNEDGHEMDTCVFECTADNFMYRVNNSLTDFHYRYHRARPLRVRTQTGFRLLTDTNYKIKQYTLGYLKKPEEITNEDPDTNYQDFPDYIWTEIVKIAAQMYIENQADPRYRTLTNEVNTQE